MKFHSDYNKAPWGNLGSTFWCTVDIEKFIKVLGMTGSTHDGEALAALRTAQRMMTAAKVSWVDLIKPKNEATYKPPQYSDIFRDASRDAAFRANRAAYEASQKAQAKKRAEQNQAEYEDIIKAYKQYQDFQSQSKRSPGFGDDLYEAIFGRKRNK